VTFIHDQYDKTVKFIDLAARFEIRSRIYSTKMGPPLRDFLNEDSPPPP
jgi:hypothetical protein